MRHPLRPPSTGRGAPRAAPLGGAAAVAGWRWSSRAPPRCRARRRVVALPSDARTVRGRPRSRSSARPRRATRPRPRPSMRRSPWAPIRSELGLMLTVTSSATTAFRGPGAAGAGHLRRHRGGAPRLAGGYQQAGAEHIVVRIAGELDAAGVTRIGAIRRAADDRHDREGASDERRTPWEVEVPVRTSHLCDFEIHFLRHELQTTRSDAPARRGRGRHGARPRTERQVPAGWRRLDHDRHRPGCAARRAGHVRDG